MSRLVDIDTTKNSSASGEITDAEKAKGAKIDIKNEAGEVIETREVKKARRAQILARGAANDRLDVNYPADKYHGEWVPIKDGGVAVHRMKSLGAWIDKEYAPSRALHSGESHEGGAVVGDCVFMMMNREDKEILDEIKKERYDALHNPRRGKLKEELDFENQAPAETLPKSESNAKRVRRQEIAAAIEAAGKQE